MAPPIVVDWKTQTNEQREMVLRQLRRDRDMAMLMTEGLAPEKRERAFAFVAAVAYLSTVEEQLAQARKLETERDGLAKALQEQCEEHPGRCCRSWCQQCQAEHAALVAIGWI